MSELHLRIDDRLGDFELDVDCRLPLRGVTALLGHSGAGKSSLLAALAGVRMPRAGRIELAGDVLFDSEQGVAVPPEARGLGCVLQRPCLFPHMSVERNCLYGATQRGLSVPAQRAGQVLRWLDLQALLGRRPAGLSGGEQQRVALARALLSQPRLLLLDEPLAAVDARRRDEVLPYLEQVCSDAGVPVIYVSHVIDDVARLADRIVVLQHGRVLQQGTAHDVLTRGVQPVGFAEVNVLDGTLETAAHDRARVRLGQTQLLAEVAGEVPAGARVRIVVRADDVHLATTPPTQISADNVLPGHVRECLRADDATRTFLVDCGGLELTANVSAAAAERLALTDGAAVHAVFRAPRARPRGTAQRP